MRANTCGGVRRGPQAFNHIPQRRNLERIRAGEHHSGTQLRLVLMSGPKFDRAENCSDRRGVVIEIFGAVHKRRGRSRHIVDHNMNHIEKKKRRTAQLVGVQSTTVYKRNGHKGTLSLMAVGAVTCARYLRLVGSIRGVSRARSSGPPHGFCRLSHKHFSSTYPVMATAAAVAGLPSSAPGTCKARFSPWIVHGATRHHCAIWHFRT